MSVGGTILLIIIVPIAFYALIWFYFHHIFKRPFLQGPPQYLVKPLHLWIQKWPPGVQWPFTSPPEDPIKLRDWKFRWYAILAYSFVLTLFGAGFATANSISTITNQGNNNAFVVIAYCIMGILIVFPACAMLCDACTGIMFIGAYALKKPLPNSRKNWEMERWAFLMSLWVIFSLVGFNTGYTWGQDGPIVRTVEVPLHRLPLCMDKLRVVMFTDIHTGPNVNTHFVAQMVKTANALQAEIVLHVGDGGDGKPDEIGRFNLPLANIQCPNRYFVTGNHEYLHGNVGGAPWEDFYQNQANFEVLHNKAASIGAAQLPWRSCGAGDTLKLVGIPDSMSGESDLNLALSGVNVGEEWIFLSHKPETFPEAADRTDGKHVGLQVSGHVHGGNCFPLHPIVYLASKGLFSGLIREKDSFIFVSNGNANWGSRMRLFSRPHNTLLILRHAATFESEGKVADVNFTSETQWAIAGLVVVPLWLVAQLSIYLMEKYDWHAWWRDGGAGVDKVEAADMPAEDRSALELLPLNEAKEC